MTFIWKNPGTHILNMQDNVKWILYADHEYEEATIELVVDNQTYELANEWEYLQGREHMRLNTYDVFDFYSEVVLKVTEMVCEEHINIIDLDKVKEEILGACWWDKWKSTGRVTDDYFCDN